MMRRTQGKHRGYHHDGSNSAMRSPGMLSRIAGIVSAMPWHKRHSAPRAGKRSRPLQMEGLERREVLDGETGDIDIFYHDSPFSSRIGPALYFTQGGSSGAFPVFKVGGSQPWKPEYSPEPEPTQYDLNFSVSSDMKYGEDYRVYVTSQIITIPQDVESFGGTVETSSNTTFWVSLLKPFKANDQHWVEVKIHDGAEYDVPGSPGYHAETEYNTSITQGETWYNTSSRRAYFVGGQPRPVSIIDCDCDPANPGDTQVTVRKQDGSTTIDHKLAGSSSGTPAATAQQTGANNPHPILRAFDILPRYDVDPTGAVDWDAPSSIKVRAAYYQQSGSTFTEVSGTSVESWFTPGYDGSQVDIGSAVQYAIVSKPGTLPTGVYKWKMEVTYYWDDEYSEPGTTLEGWQLILSDANSIYGNRWQYDEVPFMVASGDLTNVILRQGREAFVFNKPTPSSAYTAPVGLGDNVNLIVDDGFTYTDKFGTTWNFAENGRPLQYVDRNNNKVEYQYSAANAGGDLLRILYPNGRRTIFEYSDGYVSKITRNALSDGSGGTETLFDIENGLLMSITSQDADPGDDVPAPLTEFEYDPTTKQVTQVTRYIASPLDTEPFDPETATKEITQYLYHAPSGTVSDVQHSTGPGCTCGESTMQLYAAERWGTADPTIVVGGYAQGTAQNPAPLRPFGSTQGWFKEQIDTTTWRQTDFTIDGHKLINSTTVAPGTAEEATTTYDRNSDGLIWRSIEADPDGESGPLTSQVTTFNYDDDLNLETVTLANGDTQEWEYGDYSQVTKYTDEYKRETRYQLDEYGNVEVMQQVVGSDVNTLGSQGDDVFTQYFYTEGNSSVSPGARLQGGLITKIIDPLGNITQYKYYRAHADDTIGTDFQGPVDPARAGLVQQIDIAVGSDDADSVSFTYDTYRRMVSKTDELERTTDYAYDALDNLISITEPDADSSDSWGRPVTTFTYDTLGRLVRQEDPDPDDSGPRDAHWTEYHYANNDRTLTVRESPRESEGEEIETIYDYDMLGRLIKVVDAAGNETTYTYTALNQTDTVTLPTAGEGAPPPVFNYDYDLVGRLTQVTQPSAGARTAPTPHEIDDIEVTDLDLQSVVVLYDPATPASAAFVDTVDADSALRYEIVSVDGPTYLFKSLRFSNDGGRKLILEYSGFINGDATITLRATNTAGMSSEVEIEVSRDAIGNTFQTVNTTTAGDQQNSSVAAFTDADGGYVVVWEGAGPSGSDDYGIWFQRFDKFANKLGSQTLVNATTTGVQAKPAVAASSDGFAVVWYDYANSSYAAARWRTFNKDGSIPSGSSEGVAWSNIAVPLGGPAITRLLPTEEHPNSRYVVLWALVGASPNGVDIYGAIIDADGDFVSSAFRANPGAPGTQQRPSIAPTQDGGFIVAWDGEGSYGSTTSVDDGIFFRKFDEDASSPWVETRVDLTNEISSFAATSDGGLVVVWQDQETSTSDAVIKGRRFGADGIPISGEFIVADGSYSYERPSVAGTPDGGFVVAWHGGSNGPNYMSMRRYDRFGVAGDPVSVQATTTASPVDIVVGANGGIFATWTHGSSGATNVIAELGQLPALADNPPALQIESIEPGQAIFGPVTTVLVTFNTPHGSSLTLSAVSLIKPDGSTISTGFTATRISWTQFLLSMPAELNLPGTYQLNIGTGLVSGLSAPSTTTFTLLPDAEQAGGVSHYSYDELNRLAQLTDLAGGVTKYDYTVQSNKHLLVTESRYLPSNLTTAYSTTTSDYDQLGRLVLVTLPAVAGLSASTFAYAYDKNSNLLRTTDQRGAKTDYRYDARGRLVRRYNPNATSGESVNGSDSPLGPATQYKYTDANELEEIIGPTVLGISGTITPHTKYEYDGLGRVKKVISADPMTGDLSSTIYTSYVHDQIGNVISMTEPVSGVTPLDTARTPTAALTTTYGYDTQSNLTKITMPAATVGGTTPYVDFSYDDLGRRTQMIDELGRYTNYEYDGRSNLTSVIQANPGDINDHSLSSAARPTYKYQYDVLDNLLIETDPLGRRTQYNYDAASRLTHQIDALGGVQSYGYDAFSRNTARTDALGRVTDFEFDQRDQLRKVTEANPLLPGQTGYSSTGRPEHLYDYDQVGNLVKYTDPLEHVTDYTFDFLGQLTDVYQPTVNGSRPRTQYAYDAAGNPTSVTDPMSRVTSYWHDALGRLVRERAPDPTNTSGTGGLVTNYGYDNYDQLVSISKPDPAASGQYILTTFDYDAAGRVLRETQPEVPESYTNGSWFSTAHRTAVNYGYDLAGQLVSVEDQMSVETAYAYDYLGRQTTKTVLATSDPDHDIVTSFGYDAVGNQTRVTDPMGAVTFNSYDDLNRVSSVLDAREGITRFGFDAVGNQTTIIDAVGNINRWSYDRLNRLASDTDPLGKTRTYGYDKAGNLTSQTDRLGQKRTFGYDELDRRTAENWIDTSDGVTVTRTLSWDYNATGDLTKVNDLIGTAIASATYDYHYDAAGRLDKSLSTLAGMGSTQAVFQVHTSDALGRRTGLATTRGGTFNSTSFTVSGGTADISNTYVYDKQSRLRRAVQTSPSSNPDSAYKRVDLMYNDRGQISTIYRQSETVINYIVNSYYDYDSLGRQRSQQDWVFNSWGPKYDWWYDDSSRVTKEVQTFEGNTVTFNYDSTGQLTQTNSNNDSVLPDSSYVHDLAGNRQNVGDGVGAGNQLAADADFLYTYDYEGNRTSRARKEGASSSLSALTTYDYDFRNRLVRVTIFATNDETATSAVEYTYDALDRRVARREIHFESDGETIDSQATEYYVYDEGSTRATPDGAHGSGDVLFDFYDEDGTGTSETPELHRRYFTAIDLVFAQENLFIDGSVTNSSNPSGAPVGTYWLIQDRLGTVRTIIGSDQVVWNHAQYDAFGNRVGLRYPHGTPYALDSSITRYGFTGQEYDELTELTWYSNGQGRGRWYDAHTNNFIQPDVVGLANGPNIYSYVHNSPTNNVDPSGQVLVAIDGTGSKRFRELEGGTDPATGRVQSHTRNFWEDYRGRPGERRYFDDGPASKVLNVNGQCYDIMGRAMRWLLPILRANPDEEINLVGHSRGGYIVMQIARQLEKLGYRVNFLGLYDAVDSASNFGDGEKIPSNVDHSFHAQGQSFVKSRWYFNTADHGPEDETADHVVGYYTCTHAGIGGAPWHGDHPKGMIERVDREQSELVDRQMREQARRAGITFRGDATR